MDGTMQISQTYETFGLDYGEILLDARTDYTPDDDAGLRRIVDGLVAARQHHPEYLSAEPMDSRKLER